MVDRDYLFCENEAREVFRGQKEKLAANIDSQPANYILNVGEGDYIKYLLDDHSVDPPVLHSDTRFFSDSDLKQKG